MANETKGRVSELLEELETIVEGRRRDYSKKPLKRLPTNAQAMLQKITPLRRRFERVSKQAEVFQRDLTNMQTYFTQAVNLLRGKEGTADLVRQIEAMKEQAALAVGNFHEVHKHIDSALSSMERFQKEVPKDPFEYESPSGQPSKFTEIGAGEQVQKKAKRLRDVKPDDDSEQLRKVG